MQFKSKTIIIECMKCVIQRVKYARVFIDEKQVGKIEKGALLLLGIEKNDGENDISKLLRKILELRIFSNDKGQFDYSLLDIKGDLMVVSQFTLMANCAKGRRPSFESAAQPSVAKPLVDQFIQAAKKAPIGHVASGEFGANMQIELINDGPVTISLNSVDV